MSREIVVCGGDYEHVLDFDGPSNDEQLIRYRRANLGELSRVVLDGKEFDAAEYSLANYIMLKDRQDDRLTAIPVFPNRAFRNASVFVRADSPLHDARQLAGKKVGVSDFAMTTAVWTRGHLFEETGLDWTTIEWVTGAAPRFASPEGVRSTPSRQDLEDLLIDGKIDALMAGKPRDLKLPADQRRLRYLVDDAQQIEKRYYAATGIFPIMHTLVLHPRIASVKNVEKQIFDTYVRAKKAALKRRLGTTFMPWAEREWERYCPPGGIDPYRHGLTELNRKNIETLSRYLLEQKFIGKMPIVDDLFVPGSAEWVDQ